MTMEYLIPLLLFGPSFFKPVPSLPVILQMALLYRLLLDGLHQYLFGGKMAWFGYCLHPQLQISHCTFLKAYKQNVTLNVP